MSRFGSALVLLIVFVLQGCAENSGLDPTDEREDNFCEDVCFEVCDAFVCRTIGRSACESLGRNQCTEREDCELSDPEIHVLTAADLENVMRGGAACAGVCELYTPDTTCGPICVTSGMMRCEELDENACSEREDCVRTFEQCDPELAARGDLQLCLEDCRKN
jgi:hypothetical protein